MRPGMRKYFIRIATERGYDGTCIWKLNKAVTEKEAEQILDAAEASANKQ